MSAEGVVDGNTWQILQASPILHGAVDFDDLSPLDMLMTQASSELFVETGISTAGVTLRIISTMRTAANPSRGIAMASNTIRNERSIFIAQIIDHVSMSWVQIDF